MVIRPARPDEFEAIGELVVAAYRQLPDAALTVGYEPGLRDIAARAAVATVLVAIEDDGTPLGSVTYVDGPGPLAEDDAPDEAHVRMLAVAPSAQGRGVGRALMDACIQRARDAGKRRVLLRTRASMTRAHRLYADLGFRREPSLDRDRPAARLLAYALQLS
jgi:ribosomal protein S18 acetylase RimI-like enzyme